MLGLSPWAPGGLETGVTAGGAGRRGAASASAPQEPPSSPGYRETLKEPGPAVFNLAND